MNRMDPRTVLFEKTYMIRSYNLSYAFITEDLLPRMKTSRVLQESNIFLQTMHVISLKSHNELMNTFPYEGKKEFIIYYTRLKN